MTIPRSTVIAALVTGSLAMGFGTAHADPAQAPAPEKPTPVNYSLQLVEKTVVATLQGGSFSIVEKEVEPVSDPAVTEGGEAAAPEKDEFVEVKDKLGNLLVSWPLDFSVAGTEVPVKPVLKNDDTVLELTPEKTDIQVAQPVNAVNLTAKPIASPSENQSAMNEFTTQFSLATAVGGFLGTAIGVVAGGIVGCILGLPLFAVGCIPAAVAGAGIGGILGTVAFGGPALAVAGMELINTIQAPAGTSKWANDGKPVTQEEPAPAPAEK
ncbi:hypothetical protein ABZV91_17290 [Nocardia sp. NPDC004568]|uniref:hypothetical protein n=1 Tax=Nocardia sp. NPDC004568 TaxID=3154551 RepID=UPI00339E6CE3